MSNRINRSGGVVIFFILVTALSATPLRAQPKVDRTVLKGYFERGDKPSQAQFATLIDSMVNRTEVDGGLTPPLPISLDGIAVSGSTNNALRLSEGEVIDDGLTFTPAGNHPVLEPLWAGEFGFLPLRFHDDNQPIPNTYFGYLQIRMDGLPPGGIEGVFADLSDPPLINVDYLVYGTSPNTPLTVTAVPEPTGVIASVAFTLATLRPRRRHAVAVVSRRKSS